MCEELSELQKYVNELQQQDQDKAYRLQKLTEDSIQMQNDIMVMTKEKERFAFEREDYERQIGELQEVHEEYKKVAEQKQDLQEKLTKSESQNELLKHKKQQGEVQIQLLMKDKEDLQKEVSEVREQLTNEQKKLEANYKNYNEQI